MCECGRKEKRSRRNRQSSIVVELGTISGVCFVYCLFRSSSIATTASSRGTHWTHAPATRRQAPLLASRTRAHKPHTPHQVQSLNSSSLPQGTYKERTAFDTTRRKRRTRITLYSWTSTKALAITDSNSDSSAVVWSSRAPDPWRDPSLLRPSYLLHQDL